MSLMDDYFDIDSACSTPYVSAPSSPGRSSSGSAAAAGGGFFYSAPASPMHFILSSSALTPPPKTSPEVSASNSFEFEFSARFPSAATADELFLNGQIRPMKLSSHLQRPQILAPLIDLDESEHDLDDNAAAARGRGEAKWRDRSLRRRTRSMSPLRTSATWDEIEEKREEKEVTAETEDETPSMSASSSRSSSGNRSSKRWIFLKEFLYRSKSEGRNNSHKFWNNFSFSTVKDKKPPEAAAATAAASVSHSTSTPSEPKGKKKAGPTNGVGKRRVPASPHEIHYRANRAQAEERRKKTFLPYRQGLIGCLGFSSKSYGAVNGLARALNPVSSR